MKFVPYNTKLVSRNIFKIECEKCCFAGKGIRNKSNITFQIFQIIYETNDLFFETFDQITSISKKIFQTEQFYKNKPRS